MKPTFLKPFPFPVLMPRAPGGEFEPAKIVFAEFDHAGHPVYAAVEFADGYRNLYRFSGSTYTCINSGHFLDVFVIRDQHPQEEAHSVFSTQVIFSEDGLLLDVGQRMTAIGYRWIDVLERSPFTAQLPSFPILLNGVEARRIIVTRQTRRRIYCHLDGVRDYGQFISKRSPDPNPSWNLDVKAFLEWAKKQVRTA